MNVPKLVYTLHNRIALLVVQAAAFSAKLEDVAKLEESESTRADAERGELLFVHLNEAMETARAWFEELEEREKGGTA